MDNERRMLRYEEAWDYLNEVAENIPKEIYNQLNGGIILQPGTAVSPHSLANDLFTLGSYHYEPRGMGRYINIFYGSFLRACRGKTIAAQKEELRKVLYHEFVHHLENLAGVRDLEEEDKRQLKQYFEQHKKQDA